MRIPFYLKRLMGKNLKWYVATYECATPGHDGAAPSRDIIEGNMRSALVVAESECPPGFRVDLVVQAGTAEGYVHRCMVDQWEEADEIQDAL